MKEDRMLGWIVIAIATVAGVWLLGRQVEAPLALSDAELRRRQQRGWTDASVVKNDHY